MRIQSVQLFSYACILSKIACYLLIDKLYGAINGINARFACSLLPGWFGHVGASR
jgi:hypothetical protein